MKKALGLLLASLLASACALAQPAPEAMPQPPTDPAMQPPMPPPDIYSTFNAICEESDRTMQMGNTNESIMLLDSMFNSLGNCKAMAFDKLIKTLVAAGNIEDAKARYLWAAMQDKELARSGCEIIRRHYQSINDMDGASAWSQELMRMDLPPAILVDAHAWYVEACCAKDAYDKAIDILPECIERFDGSSNRRIFLGPIGSLIAAGKTDQAEKMLNAIAKQGEKQPELKAMVAMERTIMLWKMDRLADAELNFVKTSPTLADGDIQQVIARLKDQASSPETVEALNRMCEYVVKNLKDKPAARHNAATRLLENAKKTGKGGDIPGRLEFLMKSDIPPQTLLNLYSLYFYDVITTGTRNDLRSMLAIGNTLFAKLDKLDDKRAVKILELDGVFVMDDYEGAIKLIAENKSIWETDWEPMANNKIRAHLALQKSKLEKGEKQKQLKQEAITRFRENLKYIEKWEDPQLEPLTGLIYTRNIYLGINLKRIGDLLKSIGDDAAAATSFKEAEDYYKKALAETKPDSREHAFITEKISEIYTGPAKEVHPMPAASEGENIGKDKAVKGEKK